MNALEQDEAICRIELLAILRSANSRRRKLTKLEIIYIHHLMRIRNHVTTDDSLLSRYKRINIMNTCDYDEIMKRFILNGVACHEILGGILKYHITDKGKNIFENFQSPFAERMSKHCLEILNEFRDKKRLRDAALAEVVVG